MARRAREREQKAEQERRLVIDTAVQNLEMLNFELNGWPRHDAMTVRMGTSINCIGCGRCLAVVCTAFPDDWQPPGPDPEWTFPQEACQICRLREQT